MESLYSSYTPKDWILVCVRFIIGAMFIFSGIVKLFPIEPFELKFVELGVANWTTAPLLARLVIAGELFLGFLLLLNIKPRFTSLTALSVLVFFTFYLIYDFLKNGNEGNCGCFGTVIVMTPLESIVKNLLMIPLGIALLFMNKKGEFTLNVPLSIISMVILAISIPFILSPLESAESHENANSEKVEYKFPVELISDFNIKGSKVDLRKGAYIVTLMSVKCSHCKKAAYKLHILNKQNKLPPIYMILLGTEEEVPTFVEETKADFPYYLLDENTFFELAGNSIPRIFYIRNGVVKAKFNERSLTESSLLEAMKRP